MSDRVGDMVRDPYKALGVSRDASEEEIRKAYRGLARRHHPDANPQDSQAEERFKELQRAYEVLKEAGKRSECGRRNRGPSREARAKSRPARTSRGEFRVDLADLFSSNRFQGRQTFGKEEMFRALKLLGMEGLASRVRVGTVAVEIDFGPRHFSGAKSGEGSSIRLFPDEIRKPSKPPKW